MFMVLGSWFSVAGDRSGRDHGSQWRLGRGLEPGVTECNAPALPNSAARERRPPRRTIKPVESQSRTLHVWPMSVFESTAVLEDSRHLTLGRPVPGGLSRDCRVIVMFDVDNPPESWPQGFGEAIRIEDAAFERPAQGSAPFISALDA